MDHVLVASAGVIPTLGFENDKKHLGPSRAFSIAPYQERSWVNLGCGPALVIIQRRWLGVWVRGNGVGISGAHELERLKCVSENLLWQVLRGSRETIRCTGTGIDKRQIEWQRRFIRRSSRRHNRLLIKHINGILALPNVSEENVVKLDAPIDLQIFEPLDRFRPGL